jgi:nitrate/nitrite transporter NarK
MRAALAVIVAFVSMSVVVFGLSVAPWFMFGLDAVLVPSRFDSTATFDAYAVVVGILGAMLGGWLCARLGRSRHAVLALAVMGFIGGMTNVVMQSRKPEPGARRPGVMVPDAIAARKEPLWFTLLMPCVGAAGILVGGGRADVRRSRDRAPTA